MWYTKPGAPHDSTRKLFLLWNHCSQVFRLLQHIFADDKTPLQQDYNGFDVLTNEIPTLVLLVKN